MQKVERHRTRSKGLDLAVALEVCTYSVQQSGDSMMGDMRWLQLVADDMPAAEWQPAAAIADRLVDLVSIREVEVEADADAVQWVWHWQKRED